MRNLDIDAMKTKTSHMLTVRKLVKLLQGFPADAYVVVSSGDGYSPLSALSAAHYVPETTWRGDLVDEEDLTDLPRGALKAVVLWPVN